MLKLFSTASNIVGKSILLNGSAIIPKTARASAFPCTGMRCMTTVNAHRLINTDDLQPLPYKKKRRFGRGIGSGRGKNAGRGHQFSSSTPRGFEGGQTPIYKRLPKIGFHNVGELDMAAINVGKIQEYIDMGRLQVDRTRLMTMRDLIESGIISNARAGVKLLAHGTEGLTTAVHLEVSNASKGAIKAVEAAGGTVTCTHFNKLAMRALIHPIKFELLPRRARPPPRLMDMYLDGEKCGYLSPEIQTRNLAMFGEVTSEKRLRQEHVDYMILKRKAIAMLHSEEGLEQSINDEVRRDHSAGGRYAP